VAVLPLVKKDELPEKALEIFNQLRFEYTAVYDEKDSIGKRYRRQDALGTPFCITIDHDTLSDEKVTVRRRDDMSQQRVTISELMDVLQETKMSHALAKLVSLSAQ
jgi:glycyl-tRNA synthetase